MAFAHWGLKPLLQRPNRQVDTARALRHIAPVVDFAQPIEVLIFQKRLQPFARTLGPAGQNHLTLLTSFLNMPRQLFEKIDIIHLGVREKNCDRRARLRPEHRDHWPAVKDGNAALGGLR